MEPASFDVGVLDFEIRAAAKAYRQSTMRICYYGWRLRYALMDDWSPLGVKDEEEYRQSLGIGQSTWYRCLKIGTALYTVKLADMERITVGKAELLIQVEPALWHDFPWVQEAQKLSEDEFARLIVQRHRQVGSAREPMTYFRVKVPVSTKKFLLDTLAKFRQEHNLASSAEALEYLVADVHDRPNVMAAIERANRYVKWSLFRFRKREVRNETQWLRRAHDLLKKAYWAVRMEDEGELHEKSEKEVFPAETPEELQDFAEWSRGMPSESDREDGEKTPSYVDVPPPAWYLRELPITHEPDGDDDSFEE
jgi:hypothetical protein